MKLKDKVLVVEDEQNISNFISTVLTANDFDVLVAQTGAEAVSMITSHCPDLIILDLGLPDMDGINILKEARAHPHGHPSHAHAARQQRDRAVGQVHRQGPDHRL